MNRSFFTLVSVFFFWGFLAASNGIFIPFCKSHFDLSQFQSQLVDFSFYGAYFIGSLLLYIFSLIRKKDIINSWGYKRTIIYGLSISVIGALIMLPAIGSGSFAFILSAFFIIALGFSLQQTSANPLVLNIGDPAKGSHRLNFAGSINSFGTTIGPILVSLLLFGSVVATQSDKEGASISSINILYIILAITFGLAAIILAFTKVSKLEIEEDQGEIKILKYPHIFVMAVTAILVFVIFYFAMNDYREAKTFTGKNIFLFSLAAFLFVLFAILSFQRQKIAAQNRFETASNPHITLGMLAIFVYVGVEVTIQSNMGALLREPGFGGLTDDQIGPYISVYWGSLMIGRWTGSIGAFKLNKTANLILTLIVPFAALTLVLFMNYLNGATVADFYAYAACVGILVLAFILTKQKPALTLMVFGLLGVLAMCIGLFTTGKISVYAFLSGGLFCSIMWPCIFSLATAGLGKYTSQASAFLIMMILGGAFIPPLQGLLADQQGIHTSYLITILCFGYLAWYAWKAKEILKQKGINYDQDSGSGH